MKKKDELEAIETDAAQKLYQKLIASGMNQRAADRLIMRALRKHWLNGWNAGFEAANDGWMAGTEAAKELRKKAKGASA